MGILMKPIHVILLLVALAAAGTATSSNIWTAITGHTKDLISRTTADQVITGMVIAEGEFDQDAEGRDLAHWANGTVQIIEKDGKRYIQLTEDFNSGPLPDGYVYYSHDDDINTTDDFDSTRQIEAGKLIKGKGASFYEIPVDAEVNSVTILCKAFHVYIGSAATQ